MTYSAAVASYSGAGTLRDVAGADRPVPGAVVVGTIHSVKGGEADRVVVFPDLSPRGRRSLDRPGWHHADAVYRMFYVAATRARESLFVGLPRKRGLSCPI